MMRTGRAMYSVRAKSFMLAALLLVIAALGAVVLLFRGSARSVVAESGGSVTIHVYDPTQSYASLGAWVWLRGGSGKPYTDLSEMAGEEFKKEDLGNTAQSVTANFSAEEIIKFKNGTALGFLICTSKDGEGSATVWGKYKKETADVFVDIAQAFDSNNHADVYYLRKDNIAYTNVEDAKMALEKVTSARFIDKSSNAVAVEFEATSPITAATDVEFYKNEKLAATTKAQPNSDNRFKATAVFTNVSFDFSSTYELKIKGVPTGAPVSLNAFIDDAQFIASFENVETQNLQYGALYTPEKTVFRVWAPFATFVKVNLFRDGVTGTAYSSFPMKKVMSGNAWGGVWEQELLGDYDGVYYTYTVGNPGAEVETIDPYAKAAGAGGDRGMVVDLPTTDPAGWENDKHLYASDNPEYVANADVPIVWELHVQDFSASPDSGMKYKGKYLAFTETGTTVPGKPHLKTGVDYLKELGITYVQLNPVYDFATVDETDMSVADNTKDTFNWGYDPQNYNVPDGSYSTDPTNGKVRINEFKQMIMALHNAGIGVIMDVVYNHTYSTNGQALNDTVPNYYHRTTDGVFTSGSGCGNETATERTMMRKYMIDSLKYWATEYHIDGFRFDLMGIHDVETMRLVRKELDELDGGNGVRILTYGEPWSGDDKNYTPGSFTARTAITANATGYAKNPVGNKLIKQCRQNANEWWFDLSGTAGGVRLPDRLAIFGDTGRDGLRGNNDPGQGWVNGNLGMMGQAQKMMEGYCGSSGSGIITANGSQCVAYASAHDNYTLWDQMCGKGAVQETVTFYNEPNPTRIKQCKLVASSLMMSSGIVFILAGDEMGRTKYGNHNSYNSVAKLNQIVWSRQEDFKDLHDYYQTVIKIRKDNIETFAYSGTTDVANCTGNFTGSGDGTIVYATHDKKLTCTLNGGAKSGNIKVDGQVKASF